MRRRLIYIYIVLIVVQVFLLHSCDAMRARQKGVEVRQVSIDSAWAMNSVNSTIFRRDPLASDGTRQYVAYYDSVGHLVVGKRLLNQQEWELKGTTITGGAADAHNSISIAVDGSGVLHVAFGCHCSPLQYYIGDASGSLELRKVEMVGRDEMEATYPEFYRLENGDLLFTYRDGAAARTALVLNRYDVRRAAWVRVSSAVIEAFGDLTPYWQMCVDARGGLHLTWSWRGTRDVESNHDICYAYSPDGGSSWRRGDGSVYTLPITYESAEVIAKVGPSQTLINQGTMACDGDGGVYLATYYRGAGDSVVQYHVLRKEGPVWCDHCISQRRGNFRLDGAGGTRGIPVSRPLIVARDGVCYVFCRDVEDGFLPSVYYGRCGEEPFQKKVLSAESVGYWEPTYDSWLWRRYGKLNLYVQRVAQEEGVSGENLEDMRAQPNYVMEVELY